MNKGLRRKGSSEKKTELEESVQALTAELAKTQHALRVALEQRNQAQKQQAISEERFETFLESASEGIVAIDNAGRVALMNARAEAMFGYDRTELLGKGIEILLPERMRAAHSGHRLNYLAEPRTRSMGSGLELFGRRKDGTEFPVEVGLSLLKTDHTCLATSFITDITPRKRVEEGLFRREREFKALVENSPNVISRLDPDLRYLYANPAVEHVLGCQQEDCLGKTGAEIGLPESLWRPWDQQTRNVFATGREAVFEFSIQTATGPRHHQCRIVPEFSKDGLRVESVLCITHDVTALTRAEEAHSQLAAIVKCSTDGIISGTLDGVIVSWNKAAERIHGYSAEETIGGSIQMLSPEDRAGEMPGILDKIKLGESVISFETVRRRKDGAHIDVSLTISPLRDAAGRITGFSSISRDITEQKKAAEMARWQDMRLLQADKMASLGVLVSGMAHEINNPNNYILLNSRILSNVWHDLRPILEQYYEIAGDFPLAGLPYSQAYEKIGQLLSGLAEGSQRIQKIVQSLKDFARKDTGNLNQTVNVNTVIQSGLVIMDSLIKQATDFFSVEYRQDLPTVRGNAQQLEQVIINLVANACQSLSDKTKKIKVSTRYFKQTGRIMIQVQDEGVGIAPENLRFILDPFFTTKREAGGTGLGLWSSNTIIKNHGGELAFVSQPGKGTTATVILPVARE